MQKSDVGILVIGDEILSAQVKECNFLYIAQCLLGKGYRVREVRIVADDIDAIAQAIDQLCSRYHYVISSGGIGPTHDDVSMEGIAKGFGVSLERNSKMYAHFSRQRSMLPKSIEKMAWLPKGSETFGDEGGKWPLIRKDNCIILPGLPSLLKEKMQQLIEWLPKEPSQWQALLFLQTDEHLIAESLSQLQSRHPLLSFGSYPVTDEDYTVRISISGLSKEEVHAAFVASSACFSDLLLRSTLPFQMQ